MTPPPRHMRLTIFAGVYGEQGPPSAPAGITFGLVQSPTGVWYALISSIFVCSSPTITVEICLGPQSSLSRFTFILTLFANKVGEYFSLYATKCMLCGYKGRA